MPTAEEIVQPISSARLPKRTDVEPRLAALIEEKGFAYSWQPVGENIQSALHSDGLYPLTPEMVEEWNEPLAKDLFGGSPGTRKLFTQDGCIRNVDCILMIQPVEARETLLEHEAIRRERQAAAIRSNDDLEAIKEALERVGIPVSTTTAPLESQVLMSKDLGKGGNRRAS